MGAIISKLISPLHYGVIIISVYFSELLYNGILNMREIYIKKENYIRKIYKKKNIDETSNLNHFA